MREPTIINPIGSELVVRANPGVYVAFELVDTLGLFREFYRTSKDKGWDLECWSLPEHQDDIYGLYIAENGISYLFCTFTDIKCVEKKIKEKIPYYFEEIKKIFNI